MTGRGTVGHIEEQLIMQPVLMNYVMPFSNSIFCDVPDQDMRKVGESHPM